MPPQIRFFPYYSIKNCFFLPYRTIRTYWGTICSLDFLYGPFFHECVERRKQKKDTSWMSCLHLILLIGIQGYSTCQSANTVRAISFSSSHSSFSFCVISCIFSMLPDWDTTALSIPSIFDSMCSITFCISFKLWDICADVSLHETASLPTSFAIDQGR